MFNVCYFKRKLRPFKSSVITPLFYFMHLSLLTLTRLVLSATNSEVHQWSLHFAAQWLKDPGPRSEKRTLLCDMACFLLITPLAAISGWLCLRGAQDHLQLKSRLEAVGLIALTIALFTIYILWTLVTNALSSYGSVNEWTSVSPVGLCQLDFSKVQHIFLELLDLRKIMCSSTGISLFLFF